jgi:hypothetical protein
VQPDLIPKKCESAAYGTKRKSLRKYALCTKSIFPSIPNTRWITMASCSQPRCVNSVLGPTTGVTKKPRTKKLYKGRLSLLNALSDALEQHTVKNMPQPLKLEAAHYFGSLEKAIAALKKQGKQLPGWNRRKIITVLSRMHRAKERLAYGSVCRDVPPLVSAAEAYFGSWGKALYAAGIDPNLYFVRRKWRNLRASDSIAGVPGGKR